MSDNENEKETVIQQQKVAQLKDRVIPQIYVQVAAFITMGIVSIAAILCVYFTLSVAGSISNVAGEVKILRGVVQEGNHSLDSIDRSLWRLRQ